MALGEGAFLYTATNYKRNVLAAYLSIPRTGNVQEKARFYRASTYHQRKRVSKECKPQGFSVLAIRDHHSGEYSSCSGIGHAAR